MEGVLPLFFILFLCFLLPDTECGPYLRDVIEVLDRPTGDWWTGRVNGVCGYFPHTFVALYTPPPAPVRSVLLPLCILERVPFIQVPYSGRF